MQWTPWAEGHGNSLKANLLIFSTANPDSRLFTVYTSQTLCGFAKCLFEVNENTRHLFFYSPHTTSDLFLEST